MEEEQLNVKPNDKSVETYGGFVVDATIVAPILCLCLHFYYYVYI